MAEYEIQFAASAASEFRALPLDIRRRIGIPFDGLRSRVVGWRACHIGLREAGRSGMAPLRAVGDTTVHGSAQRPEGDTWRARTFDTVVEQVKTLSVAEQRQLRILLDRLLAPSGTPPTEDEFERALVVAGLPSVPSPPGLDVERYRQYTPVTVQGKPVSETLIEDRR